MAKPKTEKTTATKQLEKLKADLKAAKKRYAAQENAQNKSAVDKLVKELAPVTETVNRERFVRVADGRLRKAISGLQGLQAVANPRSYKFSDADVTRMGDHLAEELKLLRAKFATALAGGGAKAVKAKAGNFFETPTEKE